MAWGSYGAMVWSHSAPGSRGHRNTSTSVEMMSCVAMLMSCMRSVSHRLQICAGSTHHFDVSTLCFIETSSPFLAHMVRAHYEKRLMNAKAYWVTQLAHSSKICASSNTILMRDTRPRGLRVCTVANKNQKRTNFGQEQRVLSPISRRPTAMKADCPLNARIVASPCTQPVSYTVRPQHDLGHMTRQAVASARPRDRVVVYRRSCH